MLKEIVIRTLTRLEENRMQNHELAQFYYDAMQANDGSGVIVEHTKKCHRYHASKVQEAEYKIAELRREVQELSQIKI